MRSREITLFATNGQVKEGVLNELGTAYLAGPMNGKPNNNFDVFDEAADALRSWGVQVVNPAEFGRRAGINATWQECMRHDLAALLECDSIVTLPEWRQSEGASLEVDVARRLRMPAFELDKYLAPGDRWALVAKLR